MRMDSRYLYSLRNNAAMGFIVAIGELIDNALQAHATRIVCRMLPGRFVIEDDGLGVSPEGFEALYTLGGHRPMDHPRYRISQHGRGAKDALGWFWGVTTITSRHDGRTRKMVIDWMKEAEKGLVSDHALAPVVPLVGRPGLPSFTKIVSQNHNRGDVGLPLYSRMAEQFGHTYRPALEDGVRIVLQRFKDQIEVQPEPEPARRLDQPAVDTEIRVAGRLVGVRAYVTCDTPRFGGLHIAMGGRVMDQIRTSVQVRNVYGWVTLAPEWESSTDKTAITDAHRIELDQAVEEVCHEVLEAAEKITRRIIIDELQLAVTELLRDVLRQSGVRFGITVDHTRPPHTGTAAIKVPHPGSESGRSPSANSKNIENPDDPYEDELDDPLGPEVAYDFQPLPGGEMAELRVDGGRWLIVIDDRASGG